jgi:hypothetical protein
MKRPAKLAVTAAVVLLVPLLIAAGAPGNRKLVTECAIFEPAPDGVADVSSTGFTSSGCVADGPGAVEVGANVWTDSPEPIELSLSGGLVADSGVSSGSHWGIARVLKKNATEGGRFDFEFGWDTEHSRYRYRLIVTEGIYDNTSDVVVYEVPTSQMYLYDYAADPALVKEGTVSFAISFLSGGASGGDTGTESGGQCKNGADDDGDGLVDCADTDCELSKFCVSR